MANNIMFHLSREKETERERYKMKSNSAFEIISVDIRLNSNYQSFAKIN